LIERISQSVEKTKSKLIPQIESLETSASTFLSNQSTDNDTTKSKLIDAHHYIIENLMQTLFSLDDVVCPPEFETARKKRKEAVQYTQGLIDRVDSIKDQLLHSSPTEVNN
jgi:hypothetical protein